MIKVRSILRLLLILVILSSGVPFFASTIAVAADDLPLREGPPLPSPEAEYVPDQIIVKFKETTLSSVRASLSETLGTSAIYASPFAGFQVLQIPEGKTVAEMVEAYSEQPIVEYAEPNYMRYATWSPNDPEYSLQWHFDQINLEAAWDLDTTAPNYGGDPSIIVAVMDTGVAYETYGPYVQAPDLANTNFASGRDFVNSDVHPNDDDGHGTHVCGTIAQSTNNGLGVAGIAFNTTIMPVKVLPGGIPQLADGIYHATNNGAKIINLSLGGLGTNNTERDALAYAYNAGVIIIAAMGNTGDTTNDVEYPAAYNDYVIAVGATRYDETRSYYSSYGSHLDIVAPGGDTSVDQNGDGYPDGVRQQTFVEGQPTNFVYEFFEGTSMAAPHVAGVAALILAKNPTWTPDQVRDALETTAVDKGATGWDEVYGWGLLDAEAALAYEVPAVQYEWNMDSDPGWTTSGLWAWGQPTGGGGDHGFPDPTSGYTGSNVYGYNLAGDYQNNLSEMHLTSTTINCTNLSDVTLRFWRWLGVEHPTYDHAYLRVSNNGTSWTNLWANTVDVTDSSWNYQEFDISSIANNQPTVYLRWTMGPTDFIWQYCGWNIDDVQIWAVGGEVPNNPPNAPASPLCEGVTNPTGVTDPTPEFSWTFSDPDGGDTKGAYQILVASTSANLASDNGDMWDSDKVDSTASEVSYAGTILAQNQTYYWKVKTWDNHDAEGTYCGEQQFTTGSTTGHTWTFTNAGFFPRHLPDSYTGTVTLSDLNPAEIPDEVQGVWYYDDLAGEWIFWIPGVGGELTELEGGLAADYNVLVSGACAWTIPLP